MVHTAPPRRRNIPHSDDIHNVQQALSWKQSWHLAVVAAKLCLLLNTGLQQMSELYLAKFLFHGSC